MKQGHKLKTPCTEGTDAGDKGLATLFVFQMEKGCNWTNQWSRPEMLLAVLQCRNSLTDDSTIKKTHVKTWQG